MSWNRVLSFEGIHNFRDYGGYAVRGGGRLKRGVLWRSGQHAGASDADLAKLDTLALASVFDLRSDNERANYPCRRPAGFAADVRHSDDPAPRHAPHVEAARGFAQVTPDVARARMKQSYSGICYRPELQAMTRAMIAQLAEDGAPCLVNCLAGKDRTGIAVAMVQLAAGVHHDDVVEDYLLTNTAGDVEARIAAGAESITRLTGPQDDAALRVMLGAEPEYLSTAFASIDERHGSIDGYLTEVLGVDDGLRARLRTALVES